MIDGSLLQSIVSAAAADNFSPHLVGDGLTLEGALRVNEFTVPAKVVFDDLTASEPPRILLLDTSCLPRKVLPHLDSSGELCAVDRDLYVFDRYHAGEQVRGLLVRARGVLERGLTKAAVDDIAAEFPRHWSDKWIGIEGAGYQGPACVVPASHCQCIIRPSAGCGKDAWIIETEQRLSFAADQDKPATLGQMLDWAGRWDRDLPSRLLDALRKVPRLDAILVLSAPNGVVVAQLEFASSMGLQRALGRKAAWPRLVDSPAARNWPIQRYFGRRMDLEYILGLNGEMRAPLSGKRIILVGCGAIGGYLGRMLAQNGAGLDGGVLVLVDPDKLDHLNIRRHVLGMSKVGKPKAESCKELIDDDLPGLSIIARPNLVQSQYGLLENSELVIDATGEQGVTEMLNSWVVHRQLNAQAVPGLLHVAIEGNGLAVRSFISSNEKYACARCLQPDHDSPARFSSTVGATDEPVVPCGEQAITRYGPAAPMAAAALAVQHAVDWGEGHEFPLLRVLRLVRSNTREVRPTNPEAKSQCPACTRAR